MNPVKPIIHRSSPFSRPYENVIVVKNMESTKYNWIFNMPEVDYMFNSKTKEKGVVGLWKPKGSVSLYNS